MASSTKISENIEGWSELRSQLHSRSSISHRELANLIANHITVDTKYAIRRLCREGFLIRASIPARGLYIVRSESTETEFLRNPVEAILTHIDKQIYFCYGTALFLHGISRYGRLTDYFVGTENNQNWRQLGQVRLHFIKTPVNDSIGVTTIPYVNLQIRLTDTERTLIDCIHRPKYAQGWENVLHSIAKIGTINDEHIYIYLEKVPTAFTS